MKYRLIILALLFSFFQGNAQDSKKFFKAGYIKKTMKNLIVAVVFGISIFGFTGTAFSQNKIGYISTAGGALIEFLMGKKLPGVVALENAVKTKKI